MFLPVSVYLSVSLSAGLLKKLQTNFNNEFFGKDGAWPKEQSIEFR